MIFVPKPHDLPKLLWRPAIFFFVIAQTLLAFAPLLEGRRGPDARAHVEELGTTLHHAHSDADCAACAARLLLSGAEPEAFRADAFAATGTNAPREAALRLASAWTTHSRSRAPPSDWIA